MKTTHFTRSIIAATSLVSFSPVLLAEMHTFTNTEGKTIKAKITKASSGKLTIKTKRGKSFTLPISQLSDSDQTYIKEWQEKNKYNVKASHLRLDITKKNDRIRQPKSKPTMGGMRKPSTSSKNDITYHFELGYNQSTPIEDVSVSYRIIKRTAIRANDTNSSTYTVTRGNKQFDTLTSKENQTWHTSTVSCQESTSSSTSRDGNSSTSIKKKEYILGIIATVSVNGKEIFSECAPDNFERKLKVLEKEHPSLQAQ